MLHCVNGIQQGNLKQGFGVYLYDDSTMYIGNWCNYQYNGEGILILSHGGYFRGQFNKSNIQGKGWIVTKKEILIAQFTDSQLDGRVLQYKENKWKLMIYKMGILLIIIQESQGTLQMLPEFVKQQEEYIILQQIIESRFDKQFQIKSLSGIYLGIKNGLGCRITDNTYIGQFKDGSLDGLGRFITNEGYIQDGLFKTNNQINGIEYKNNEFQIISTKVEGFQIILNKSNTNMGYPQMQIRKLREDYHKRDKTQLNRVQDKPFFLQRLKEISKDSLGYQYKEQIIYDTNFFSLSTINFQTNDVESEGQTQFPFDTQRKRSSIIGIDNFVYNQDEILNNTIQTYDNNINSNQSSRVKSYPQKRNQYLTDIYIYMFYRKIKFQFSKQLREYFFYIDHKGLLYLEETEPKTYVTAIKDERFFKNFHKYLNRNKTGRHLDYQYLSICWGEYNFVKTFATPIVYNNIIEKQGQQYIITPNSYEEAYSKENIFQKDGLLYHKCQLNDIDNQYNLMNSHKSVFFDKRDKNYLQLLSPIKFLEIFTRKKIKCEIQIPQTVVFSKGTPRLWLFNSIKTQAIMKKNSDKLNLVEICRVFCKVKQSDDFKVDSLTTLLDIVKAARVETVVHVEMMRQTKDLNKVELVRMCMESSNTGITCIQNYVLNPSNELYYIEYRQDVQTLPVNFRYFKKTQTQANDEEFFRFFDTKLNTSFQLIVKRLVEFIERAYRIKIKKLVAKFLYHETIMFLGLNELLIDVPENAPYEVESLIEEIKDNGSFEHFQHSLKAFSKKPNRKQFQLPDTIYEDDREISAKLYKKLIVHKCIGDFCDYIMEEKNRGPLQIRKNIIQDYKKYFGNKKMNEEVFQVTLPHEISFQLVLRTRECCNEVIELLKKNKIFNRTSKHHIQDYDQFNSETEYPFQFQKKEVFNLPNLYRTVKICKNCFVVYSLTSKYFDERLQSDLQVKQWGSSKSTTLQVQQIQQITTLDDSSVNKTTQERINTQHSFPDKKPRTIKSASTFRITKNVEAKTFKIFMPKQQVESAKATQQIKNNNNQMDLNRLTLGFLNYQKPPRPKAISSQQALRKKESVPSEHRIITETSNKSKSRDNAKASLYQSKSVRDLNKKVIQGLNLLYVCQQQNLEYPPECVPDILLENVYYFNYKSASLPFVFLRNEGSRNFLDESVQNGNILILCDFFDNALELINPIRENLRSNSNIILINMPGQAYSLFDSTQTFDNFELCLLIDSFLYHLHKERELIGDQPLRILGVGYGGFLAISYAAYAMQYEIGELILVNAFVDLDEMLKDTLEKSQEVFQTCPSDMQELSAHYWNSLCQSTSREEDLKLNPITQQGRIHIIQSVLQSNNLWGKGKDLKLKVFHGIKNCVINISQSQKISSEINYLDCGHKIENILNILQL